MPKTFIKQVVARDNQVYNIHKVVNLMGQVCYVAESSKPYGGVKRAETEQELTNMLTRALETGYTAKNNTISNEVTKVR